MIAVPKTGGNEHLQILAMLSQMLMDTDFKDSLINAQSVEEFMDLINQKKLHKKLKKKKRRSAKRIYRNLSFACSNCLSNRYCAYLYGG